MHVAENNNKMKLRNSMKEAAKPDTITVPQVHMYKNAA